MKLSQLKIDPEFQSKIPPLQFEEEQQLEQNIIAEGRLLNPIITWNGYILDGQNTVEARRTCNGGMELPIRCKVFYGLTKEDEATLLAIQTGNATCLTAGERLRANLVAENPDALYFVGITSNAGVEFAYDGIRAPWKIYCIETAYELYNKKQKVPPESKAFTFRRDVFQYDCYGGMRDHELCTMSSPRQLFSNTNLQ